eukprot:TRINITY_DN586_c0_g1_i7.p1 TRINITY_DN586_c0_g1~~TRINITY_DN586_c0_g1_i7.p1  ORF type:complete len:448 (-),score=150.40 TRINITY_DN586_c0_g1_i7:29-1372(-)
MPKKEGDKMQEDFSTRVEQTIPEQEKLAKSGKLNDAIENLLALEKQTRQAEDYHSTTKLAKTIVRLCFEAKDWNMLNEKLHILTKRRGQLRTVVQDFVREAMTYLDQIPQEATKMGLINALVEITEGKIYLENERARLTRMIAKKKEEEGKISEAADILQEVQVETFGQMEKGEKTDFILEQMRLCLEKKDYVRTQILSNKIARKMLNDKEFQDLKIRFYTLMNRMYAHDRKYLEICRSYHAIYQTPKVLEDEAQWKKYLQLVVIYCCLAPHDNEQVDLMNRVNDDPKLAQLPAFKQLVTLFLTKELMRWPAFEKTYKSELEVHSVFTEKVEGKNPLWEDLRKRVVEHNIRVIAGYYSRISYKRMSQLVDLPASEAEKFISDLVTGKSIFAKIDRPKGIITFNRRKNPNEFLNEWSSNVGDLLNLVESTCHLIHRENMVHKIEEPAQ